MNKRFNHIDGTIIRTLYREKIPLTIGEISKLTGISWITVKKHIDKLIKLDVVEVKEYPDRNVTKVMMNFTEFGNLAMMQS